MDEATFHLLQHAIAGMKLQMRWQLLALEMVPTAPPRAHDLADETRKWLAVDVGISGGVAV